MPKKIVGFSLTVRVKVIIIVDCEKLFGFLLAVKMKVIFLLIVKNYTCRAQMTGK